MQKINTRNIVGAGPIIEVAGPKILGECVCTCLSERVVAFFFSVLIIVSFANTNACQFKCISICSNPVSSRSRYFRLIG